MGALGHVLTLLFIPEELPSAFIALHHFTFPPIVRQQLFLGCVWDSGHPNGRALGCGHQACFLPGLSLVWTGLLISFYDGKAVPTAPAPAPTPECWVWAHLAPPPGTHFRAASFGPISGPWHFLRLRFEENAASDPLRTGDVRLMGPWSPLLGV